MAFVASLMCSEGVVRGLSPRLQVLSKCFVFPALIFLQNSHRHIKAS